MLKNKYLVFVLVLSFTFLFIGCKPIFIQENTPILIEDSPDSTLQANDNIEIEIEEFLPLTTGIVTDISNNGDNLILSIPVNKGTTGEIQTNETYLNINLFNIDTNQSTPIPFTLKNQINGYFDDTNNGIFYIESSTTHEDNAFYWSDINGNKTINISKPDELVSIDNAIVYDDLSIYGNDKSEILLISPREIVAKYIIKDNLNIKKIDYIGKYNTAIFIAYDKNDDNPIRNLYYAKLSNPVITPILIDKNVSDFNLYEPQAKILYLKDSVNNKSLYNYNFNKRTRIELYKGPINTFSFTSTGNKVIFTQAISVDNLMQNIWIMNSSGSEPIQMASNLQILNNKLVVHPYKSCLFFTTYKIDENNKNTIEYDTYMLDYDFK